MLDAIVEWENRKRVEYEANLRRTLEKVLQNHGVPSDAALVEALEAAAGLFAGALLAAHKQAQVKQKRHDRGDTLIL